MQRIVCKLKRTKDHKKQWVGSIHYGRDGIKITEPSLFEINRTFSLLNLRIRYDLEDGDISWDI